MGSYYAIVTCRNSENEIESAVNSLLRQTIKPRYIIVVDDGSTDNTHNILERLKLKNDKKEMTAGGNLSSQTFLFTGVLPTLKRSEAEEMVEQNGGQILSGVSSKLNYLVVGEDAGSKLEKAKKINSIKIISENEFLKLIGKN